VHVYLCTGCSKYGKLSVHVFISVQGLLNVEKLSGHVYILYRVFYKLINFACMCLSLYSLF